MPQCSEAILKVDLGKDSLRYIRTTAGNHRTRAAQTSVLSGVFDPLLGLALRLVCQVRLIIHARLPPRNCTAVAKTSNEVADVLIVL